MHLRQFVIEGLGHISALVADESAGVAAVIDPRRDIDSYLDEARAHDLRITHVVETHLHNDYVSGAKELAAVPELSTSWARGAGLAYGFRAVRDDDVFDVGALRFRAMETPGHTPEHVAYSVADRSRADEPVLLFSGGSLLVGGVGRTDLLGADHATDYARRMFGSLRDRVMPHEDFVAVLPTHGGGSLCSKDLASTPRTTIGFERRHNAMLQLDDIEIFRPDAARQPAGVPAVLRTDALREPVGTGTARLRPGAGGARPRACRVARRTPSPARRPPATGRVRGGAHPGLGIAACWIVVRDLARLDGPARPTAGARDVRAPRLGRHGPPGVAHRARADRGLSPGRLHALAGRRLPIQESGRATVAQLKDLVMAGTPPDLKAGSGRGGNGHRPRPLVLDVRQRDEYERGHVPGAVHLMAGDVPERLGTLPKDRPIIVMCAAGYRSSVAASLLHQAGFEDVTWVSGGVPAWRAAGYPLETAPGAD
jgi:hydroxyacylglutathione hydrolase